MSLVLRSCLALAATSAASAYEAMMPKCDRPGPEPLIVSFEGGIGCGKSTQIELLVQMQDVLGVANVSSWPEPGGAFSQMGKFWPLAHQVDLLRSHGLPVPADLQNSINVVTLSVQAAVRGAYVERRVAAMKWACEAKQWGRPLVLLERTTGTQSHVFAPLLVQEGYLTTSGLQEAETTLPAEPQPNDWMFYKLDLAQVFERIHRRNREGEDAINEYMVTNLNRFTGKYYDHLIEQHGPQAIHEMDASGDIEQVLTATTKVMWKIVHGREPSEAVQAAISTRAREVAGRAALSSDVVLLDDARSAAGTWLFAAFSAAALLGVSFAARKTWHEAAQPSPADSYISIA